MPVYLFLDFDGVLHPEPCTIDEAFVHARALATALEDHPDVRIVVSSSWREQHTLEELRGSCGPLGHRVVAVTPVLGGASRFDEIVAWLEQVPLSEWIALDDRPEWFPPDCERLIRVDGDRGLRKVDLDDLRTRLKALRAGGDQS